MKSLSLFLLYFFISVHGSRPNDAHRASKVRKTISFWTVKPHAKFTTHPLPSGHHVPQISEEDPFNTARKFIKTLMPSGREADEYSFQIRDDSYTDRRTGVSHIYAKQIFRGLPVSDGDVNVNVWKGTVISHGNAFFNSPVHKVSRARRSVHEQVPMEIKAQPFINDCTLPSYLDDGCGSTKQLSRALLNLLKVVHPDKTILASIQNSFMSHLNAIQIRPSTHIIPNNNNLGEIFFDVQGLPGLSDEVVRAQLVYAQTPEGGLELSWKVIVEFTDNVYEATLSAVDVDSERFFTIVDWVSDSSSPLLRSEPDISVGMAKENDGLYFAFPFGINDPSDGSRTAITHSKAVDRTASPYGWHTIPLANIPSGMELPDCAIVANPALGNNIGIVNFTSTVGNNVFAHENFEGKDTFINNYRPETCPQNSLNNFTFQYAPLPVAEDDIEGLLNEPRKHINASITQLFYITNTFHDIMYRYGFDEEAGNFQQYNFERGGQENDAVIANAQDGAGTNNANFLTPPDGRNGRMRMYIYDTDNPLRDSAFDTGIVIHELAHGLSTRLTGGPRDSSCLGANESGGMGEGWGDFLEILARSQRTSKDYVVGNWAKNTKSGSRKYPYSLNFTVNPDTYSSVDRDTQVHAIGSVWAEMLWVVSHKLITKHGFRDSLSPPPPNSPEEAEFYKDEAYIVPRHGNTLMVQLLVISMKLQPCRPTFFDALNALIQADFILTRGENECTIWSGFAERGLGEDATITRKPDGSAIRTDGFQVPTKCRK